MIKINMAEPKLCGRAAWAFVHEKGTWSQEKCWVWWIPREDTERTLVDYTGTELKSRPQRGLTGTQYVSNETEILGGG